MIIFLMARLVSYRIECSAVWCGYTTLVGCFFFVVVVFFFKFRITIVSMESKSRYSAY